MSDARAGASPAAVVALLVAMFTAMTMQPAAATPAVAGSRALDRELAAIVDDPVHPLASLSVLAVRAGRIVYQRQFGFRSIDNADPSRNRRADSRTLYRIASISKLVTTLGVMKLVEAGKLDLDRDAGDYLGYPLRNPHFPATPITLRMLLTHTSSLRDDAGYYWDKASGVTLADVLSPGGRQYAAGAMWAANAVPGAYFHYANLPWGVVGTIIERVTGERFDRALRRLVLDPLQLHGGFEPAEFTPADLADTATLYRKRVETGGREIWNTAGPWIAQVDDYVNASPVPRANADYAIGTNGTLFGPQGNCRLSAAGLATIMQMLMRQGLHRGKQFLRRSTVALMLGEQWRYDAIRANGRNDFGSHRESMNAWGLGNQHFIDVTGAGSGDRLAEGVAWKGKGHSGDAWGLTSLLFFDDAKQDGLVFLIGGPGFDPETYPGVYSARYRHEEKILTAMHRHLFAGASNQRKRTAK